MNWFNDLHLPFEPIQFVYGIVAICGGVARYLNSFTQGNTHFSFTIFIASSFVSGFSGYMFALLGITMGMPQPFIFMMAGVGGFFGDQTMKYLMEVAQNRTSV